MIKKKEKDKKNPDKVKYSQNYLKELIDETKGGIKSYKIIKKKINAKSVKGVKGVHNVITHKTIKRKGNKEPCMLR